MEGREVSLEQYPWDLEERAEDCFVAYLEKNVMRLAMVIPSRTVAEAKFPLVVVEAGESNNKNGTAPFTGKRQFNLTVNLVTEALNNNGADGTPEKNETGRETHRVIKSQLLGALAGNELHTALNDVGIPGIEFSSAHMTGQTRDTGDGKFITIQTIEVLAQPKEL